MKIKFTLISLLLLSSLAFASNWTSDNQGFYVMTSQTYPSPVEIGDENVLLQITFKRSEGKSLKDIHVRAHFDYPLIPIKDEVSIEHISSTSHVNALFSFSVDEKAEQGVYRVPISLTYTDEDSGLTNTIKRLVFVEISSQARLEIKNISFQPEELSVGSDFVMTVELENTGHMPASDIEANLIFTGSSQPVVEFYPSLPLKKNIIDADSISKIQFKGRITPYSSTGAFPARITITYNNKSLNYDFMFPISSGSEMDISNVSALVEPGKDGSISFTIFNRGAVSYKDIKISLSQVSSLAIMDNSIYVDDLPAHGSEFVSIAVSASRELSEGVYPITVTLQSPQGTSSEAISVIVRGKPELKAAGISTDVDSIYTGQMLSLSTQFENIGTSDARSVKVSIVNNTFIDGITESYVGSVEVDDTGTAVFDILFKRAGKQKLTLSISYTDNAGNTYEDMMCFDVYVHPAPMDLTFVYVLLILAGLYLFWRRRIKVKEQLKKVV
ncbi:hypothetical protein DRN74_01285 [Candidatus Micrarchaeota archaeon]|nr:MAG: hypothetical protein DRN74_01285 [Candidatus Micrarchaeota archaeon]